jgi:membrane-associated phospholipid phosphatase
MHWLQTLDTGLFRFVNQTLSNAAFDFLMPVASGNPLFAPVLIVAAVLLLWKGGARARLCVLMLAVILPLGDGLVCNTIKHAVGRVRPFAALANVRLPATLAAKPGAAGDTMIGVQDRMPSLHVRRYRNSMPSAHAANWFAATMVCWFFYRRSWRFMLPLAVLVGFSRIYNGVHYPSDVLAGAILGAGCAVAGLLGLNALWRAAGWRWFPLWWEQLPSLVPPFANLQPAAKRSSPLGLEARNLELERHWLRLGYLLLLVVLASRLVYIAVGRIQLGEDEAYQWQWSKHLALSYYSKPPMIAYTQFLGTTLWGDTPFGVRFFSPVFGAVLGLLLLRFMAREVSARAGIILLLVVGSTPLLAIGSTMMTVDPLSVFFWTLALLAGWRASQPDGTARCWCWVGLWMGLGFLSKYTALLQWLCWAVFFVMWRPARVHLRRPGPYIALLINGLCSLPVLIWNWQHHWITVEHVAGNASFGQQWHFTLRYLAEFLGAQLGLWNPFWFVGVMMAAVWFWRDYRQDLRLVFLFSMGAPLFLVYLLFTLHARALPNWIAPSILPLFCFAVVCWHNRWQRTGRWPRRRMVAGVVLGFCAVAILHETNLISKLAGVSLPRDFDPLHRVRGWREAAELAGQARRELLKEGKPVIVIGNDYGITGELAFYLPEAREAPRGQPLVFCHTGERPDNQFYFWPGYTNLHGVNAVFVAPRRIKTSLGEFLKDPQGRELKKRLPPPGDVPPIVQAQFESVTSLGVFPTPATGWPQHWMQLYVCRNLR